MVFAQFVVDRSDPTSTFGMFCSRFVNSAATRQNQGWTRSFMIAAAMAFAIWPRTAVAFGPVFNKTSTAGTSRNSRKL
jgi:hypothetical protein